MDFANDTRSCITIRDIPELLIAGKKVGPFPKSTQIELPNWAIEPLTNHGYVKLDPDSDYSSLQGVQNVHSVEKDSPHKGLQPIHPLLYSAINKKLIKIRREKGTLDPKEFDELERLRLLISIISQKRLSKILRVAKSGACSEKRKAMTLEERWLCEEISILATEWRDHLLL